MKRIKSIFAQWLDMVRERAIDTRTHIWLLVVNFIVWTAFVLSSSYQSNYTLSDTEYEWRTVCTSVFVPMLLEFAVDELIWMIFPAFAKDSVEDPIHHLILISLLPSTHIPMWVLGEIGLPVRLGLISLGLCGTVYGVVHWLTTICADVAFFHKYGLILSLYIISEMVLAFGVHYTLWVVDAVAMIAKAVVVVTLLIYCQVLDPILASMSSTTTMLNRCYVSIVLLSSLGIFLLWDVFCCLHLLIQSEEQALAQRILCHGIFTVLVAVLPGRVSRRGLLAAEQTSSITREMNSKKTFVRYISHEVRSPLSTTSLALDCMIDLLSNSYGPESREVLELAHDCKSTCTTAIQTLSDLLLYDKVESNMLQLECADMACYDFIYRCIHPLEKQIKLSGMRWEAAIDDLVNECVLHADSLKMDQVLRNFISNAIKFTPMGGRISLKVVVLATGDQLTSKDVKVRIEVSDTGPGISLENQSKLFGQYVQFDANKLQNGGGSGLGLWLSKSIVEAHNGIVGVHSEGEGKGSTFFFEIPGRYVGDSSQLMSGACSPTCEPSKRAAMALLDGSDASGTPNAESPGPEADLPPPEVDVPPAVIESPRAEPAGLVSLAQVIPSTSQDNLVAMESESIPRSLPDVPSVAPPIESTPILRVLIADDSPLARKIVERMLMAATIYLNAKGKVVLEDVVVAVRSKPSTPSIMPPRRLGAPSTDSFNDGGGGLKKERRWSNTSSGSGIGIGNITLCTISGEQSLSSGSNCSDMRSMSLRSFVRGESEGTAMSRIERTFSTIERDFTLRVSRSERGLALTNISEDVQDGETDALIPERRPSFPFHPVPLPHSSSPRLTGFPSPKSQSPAGMLRVGIADAEFNGPSVPAPQTSPAPSLRSSMLLSMRWEMAGSHPNSGESFSANGSMHLNDRNLSLNSNATSASNAAGNAGATQSPHSLRKISVQIEHATNGQVCVDKLQQSLQQKKPYDVILVDYYMPVLNGEQAILQMRQAEYQGVVIALTAANGKEDENRLLVAGANAVMSKPFNIHYFLRLLAEFYHQK